MGHADDGCVGHLGVLDQALFDLDAIDVLSPSDDHVLGSIGDEQVPLGVEMPQVAGVKPPIADGLGGGIGPVPVTGHDDRPSQQHLALFLGSQVNPVGPGDRNVDDGHGQADRIGPVDARARQVNGGHRRRLGQPISVGGGPHVGERVPDHPLQFQRGGGTAEGDRRDRRGVVVAAARELAGAPDHRGDGRPDAHPLALDQLEGQLRCEPAGHHHQPEAAEQSDDERGVASGHVEQRRGEQRRGLAARRRSGRFAEAIEHGGVGGQQEHGVLQVGHHAPMGGDGPLGSAGRP